MQLGSIRQGENGPEAEGPYTEQWRARAREIHAQAQQLANPETKKLMLGIGDDYDRLAQIAEAMALIRGVLESIRNQGR
jgi:hypothetical protein